jgi:pimeloyl-ACP methyl ester carboxylesterase
MTAPIEAWTSMTPTPDFAPDPSFSDLLMVSGFGEACDQETKEFWAKAVQENYCGDDGRRRIRMAAINLRDRDGLHARLFDIKCPVMWLHVRPSLPFNFQADMIF